jgi:hypothetical protein
MERTPSGVRFDAANAGGGGAGGAAGAAVGNGGAPPAPGGSGVGFTGGLVAAGVAGAGAGVGVGVDCATTTSTVAALNAAIVGNTIFFMILLSFFAASAERIRMNLDQRSFPNT